MSARDDRAEAMREACAEAVREIIDSIDDKGLFNKTEAACIRSTLRRAVSRIEALPLPATPADDAVRDAALAVEPDALVNAIMGSDLVRLYGIKNIEVARYHARQIARVYRALAAERAAPATDDEAREERIEKLRDEGFAMYAAHGDMTRNRDEWKARAERAEARFKAMEQQYENAMDAIHRNAGARRDGLCGILAWIDTVKAERDSARALLREARVAVDLWTDDHRCGEDVSLKPDYAAQLRARIDAEAGGAPGSQLCVRCQQPRSAQIHGPVEGCTEDGAAPSCREPKAHHSFVEK